MKHLSKIEFKSLKKSDTIVVYGSGYSVNNILQDSVLRKQLGEYDSIGFNWFLKSRIPTTYYAIREQSNTDKRICNNETRDILYKDINSYYKSSALIIHKLDMKYHKKNTFCYSGSVDKFSGNGIIINDIKFDNNLNRVDLWKKTDIFDIGIIHGKISLNGVCHFSINMGYERIIFAGIDLNDSRYFWLQKDQPRHTIEKKKKNIGDKHPVYNDTISLIGDMRKHLKIKMEVVNKTSLLRIIGRIPVWKPK